MIRLRILSEGCGWEGCSPPPLDIPLYDTYIVTEYQKLLPLVATGIAEKVIYRHSRILTASLGSNASSYEKLSSLKMTTFWPEANNAHDHIILKHFSTIASKWYSWLYYSAPSKIKISDFQQKKAIGEKIDNLEILKHKFGDKKISG